MKIGILTEYYNSRNYGGVLQAYALCKFLRDHGFDAEQIPYDKNEPEGQGYYAKRLRNAKGIKKKLIVAIEYLLNRYVSLRLMSRTNAFKKFRKEVIPHNKEVFTDESLPSCLNEYDAFVVGSDQVWNPNYHHPGYYLQFVPENKRKLSYAASAAVSNFTAEQEEMFQKILTDFDAVSVREEMAVKLLQPLTSKPVQVHIDPTLLLDQNEWDQIASDRSISDEYIFAYFLGSSEQHRKLTEDFAKAKNLKIVFLPYVQNLYRRCDSSFGDIRLVDVSPQDFLALIKNAEYVITDSFHAVVFSYIYKKNFFVFSRGEMSSRIQCITDLFGQKSRYCSDTAKLTKEYMLSQEDDCFYDERHIQFLKEQSVSYFEKLLK